VGFWWLSRLRAIRLTLMLLIALGFSGAAFNALGGFIVHNHEALVLEHCASSASDKTCHRMPVKAPETMACLDMSGCSAGFVLALPLRVAAMDATQYAEHAEILEQSHPNGRSIAPDAPIPLV